MVSFTKNIELYIDKEQIAADNKSPVQKSDNFMRASCYHFPLVAIFLALYFCEEDPLYHHNLLDHFTFFKYVAFILQ
jgi:hypothetical protein